MLFHTLRLPLYWARLVARSPVGAGRLLMAWWRWTLSDEAGRHVHQVITATVVGTRAAHVTGHRVGLGGGPMRLTRAAGAERAADPAAGVTSRLDAETFLRLSAHHKATVRTKDVVSAAALIVGHLPRGRQPSGAADERAARAARGRPAAAGPGRAGG